MANSSSKRHRLILFGPSPVKPISGRNQTFTTEVTEVREVVDPLEQTTDWFNVIAWATTGLMIVLTVVWFWTLRS